MNYKMSNEIFKAIKKSMDYIKDANLGLERPQALSNQFTLPNSIKVLPEDFDQTDLQYAIDNSSDGATIYLPPCDITVNSSINVNKPIAIIGCGEKTLFRAGSTSSIFYITHNRARISNLMLYLNGSVGTVKGIYLCANQCTIDHIFGNYGTTGGGNDRFIYVNGDYNLIQSNNWVDSSGDNCYMPITVSSSSNNNSVIGNIITNGLYLIGVYGVRNMITGNICYSATTAGIYLSNHYNTITGNWTDSGNTGIMIYNSKYFVVTGNYAYGTSHGIAVSASVDYNSDHFTIVGNEAKDVSITGFAHSYVSANNHW